MMDFLLQHAAKPAEIRAALTAFYHVPEGGLTRESCVAAETYDLTAITGDVAWRLSVYRDARDTRALARFLAHSLPTKVIISDDSPNPYAWVLLDEAGWEQPIYQDTRDEQAGSFLVDCRHQYLLTN